MLENLSDAVAVYEVPFRGRSLALLLPKAVMNLCDCIRPSSSKLQSCGCSDCEMLTEQYCASEFSFKG